MGDEGGGSARGDSGWDPNGVRRRRSSGAMPTVALGTVLVVDDDPGMLVTLERMVARAGYDVICVADPNVALGLCLDERPDLILSDLDMPVLDGLELARRVRAMLGEDAPPVVILTGGDVSRAERSEIAAVLPKPVSLEPLLAVVAETLRERRAL